MEKRTYHREFVALIDAIKTYGGSGAIGITPTFVSQTLQEMHQEGKCTDPMKPSSAELAETHKKVRDKFLAALMLSGAN